LVLDNVSGAGNRITAAIQSASQTTGTPFNYLVQTAARESAFDPKAQATTSSARGLFQFIESTWLGTMKESGAKYGFGTQAAAIDKVGEGQYAVRDPMMRAQILKMRDDPKISALMAGALANHNAEGLSASLGRQPTSGELYIAHFLGLAGAKKLITMKEVQPEASAASAFPAPAKANRSIFYDRHGRAKSAATVYASLVAKHDHAPKLPQIQVASAARTPSREASVVLPPEQRGEVPLQMAQVHHVVVQLPDLENDTNAKAALASEGPIFQTMFHNEHGPISSTVREIWTRGGATDAAERRRFFPSNAPVTAPEKDAADAAMPGAKPV
jgi:hypothetical protein